MIVALDERRRASADRGVGIGPLEFDLARDIAMLPGLEIIDVA